MVTGTRKQHTCTHPTKAVDWATAAKATTTCGTAQCSDLWKSQKWEIAGVLTTGSHSGEPYPSRDRRTATLKHRSKPMKNTSIFVLLVLMAAASLFAHHGTGISYDQDTWITVKGTVTEFAWKNPHSQLYL